MPQDNLPLLPNDVIKINIIGCTNLIAADVNGFSDGYAIIESFEQVQQHSNNNHDLYLTTGGKLSESSLPILPLKTTVKKKSLNPMWNESFSMPPLEEAMNGVKIKIKVMDMDLLSKDDFLGQVELTIDNSIGANIEKIFNMKLNNVAHGEISVGITIERMDNLAIDTYRHELVNTPSTRHSIHKGKRYLHFQCPDFFTIDKDESQETQRILLRNESKTLQFYILENALDYPFGMVKEKAMNLSMFAESYRKSYHIDEEGISFKLLNYFDLNSKFENLELKFFRNELNGQLRSGKGFVFNQSVLPHCTATMVFSTDSVTNDVKDMVLLDFILNSILFEERE